MNGDQINQLLREKSLTPSKVARKLGADPSIVTNAIRHGKGTQKARLFIAHLLEMPPSRIWVNVPRSQIILDDDIFYHPDLHGICDNNHL